MFFKIVDDQFWWDIVVIVDDEKRNFYISVQNIVQP